MGNLDTKEDILAAIEHSKETFKTIQRHFARVMEMYEDFEDVIVKLDKRLYEIENDISHDDTLLKETIAKLEASNEHLTKELKKHKKLKEADSVFDMIPDI